jgi:hypothetical protein
LTEGRSASSEGGPPFGLVPPLDLFPLVSRTVYVAENIGPAVGPGLYV